DLAPLRIVGDRQLAARDGEERLADQAPAPAAHDGEAVEALAAAMARQRLDLPTARDDLGRDVLALRDRLHGGAQERGEPGRGYPATHARWPLGPALGRARETCTDRGQDGASVPFDRAGGEAADVS